MFVDFLFHLRERGVAVSTTEFLSLLDALQRGLVGENLDRFYLFARALLIKRVEHYDIYDQAFAEFFHDRPFTLLPVDEVSDDLLSWLNDPRALRELSDQERALLEAMSLEELRKKFEERLREQKERHDGGNHWVGTGGTSPFGNNGAHPSGVRVGGSSRGRSAVQVASERRFRNLRSDLTLDVRQISVALRKLRVLARRGVQDELDLDGTIEETARNAGDLEIKWRAPRKNRVKLMLLMDVGGSMTPYSRLCSRLFSAAHQASHFQAFESYYFHNCPYEVVYSNMAMRERVSFRDVLRNKNDQWKCIVVGDAAMAPGELMYAGGSIDMYHLNERAGIDWLRELSETIPSSVWLNPDPVRYWASCYTVGRIRELFPMFALTLDGLEEAMSELRKHAV